MKGVIRIFPNEASAIRLIVRCCPRSMKHRVQKEIKVLSIKRKPLTE